MPFRELYMTAFKNDIEYSQLILQTAAILQSNKFIQVTAAFIKSNFIMGCMMETSGLTAFMGVVWIFCVSFQPLLARKNELDKLRKEVKEQWQREQKKMVSRQSRRLHF